MTVLRRKTSRGMSKYYTYRFKINTTEYSGKCLGRDGKIRATTKQEALEYEKLIKDEVKELQKEKTVKALVENRREEMTGGRKILLEDAFNLASRKPRRKTPSSKQLEAKQSFWRDFVSFMKSEYPDARFLSDVRKTHAEEYISHIRRNGRYNKHVAQSGKCSYERKYTLSNKTCNAFQIVITEVFTLLRDDGGLIENPFSHIEKLDNKSETREAFTEQELKTIFEQTDDFVYPLFCIGISTALREEDVCLLKWSEIDFENGTIRRKMEKTGNYVEIPILPPLHTHLEKLRSERSTDEESEYVLPEHAKMYLINRTGISSRIKAFLDSLGIKTQKEMERGRRNISVKDFHSLRHTFCYLCGMYNVPFVIVKAVVGHLTDDMTHMYQKHADIKAKREKLAALPIFFGSDVSFPQISESTELQRSANVLETLNQKEQLKCEILDAMAGAEESTLREVLDILRN